MSPKRKVQAGTSDVTRALEEARAHLEKTLLIDSAAVAMRAESGTGTHGFENILGVGIGEKISGGTNTGEHCVTVYVLAKVPKKTIDYGAMVPEEVNRVPTDVVEVGEIIAQPYRGRYRPAPGGVSVGHFKITAGTIACMVQAGSKKYILSNNHVLANSNSAKIGDAILQPGAFDGGMVPADVIAKLSKFVTLKFGGVQSNFVDCAIAAPTKSGLVIPTNIGYGTLRLPTVLPSLGLNVKKAGRTTQKTTGRISGVNVTVKVSYGTSGVALFKNQFMIVSLGSSPFSAGGDSGSLIITHSPTSSAANHPVGLLFAGSATNTIANPIGAVLTALGVQITT
jgi:hypothetical protein